MGICILEVMPDPQLILFFVILAVSILAFMREWLPIDVTALLVLAALLATGLIDESEAIAGFSNPAVITIGAMFILSQAFTKTGFIHVFTQWLENNGRGRNWLVIVLFLLSVVFFSAFINNTATVAILIPVATQLASRLRISPSKIMMPLSYAAIVGGTCTLIGTSTNLIVNDLARDYGIEVGIFELAKLGVIMVVITLAYSLFAQRWLLPSRLPVAGLTRKYHLGTYLTEVRISPESPMIGKTLLDCDLAGKYEITVLEILRNKQPITTNIRFQRMEEGDVLIIQCPVNSLVQFKDEQKVLLLTDIKMNDSELADNENVLVEALIPPNSSLAGSTLKEIDFRKRYGVFVLAVRRYREIIRKKIAYVKLKTFDSLLIFGSRTRVSALASDSNFIVLEELEHSLHKIRFWWLAVAVIPVVVLSAALHLVSIMTASLIGAVIVMALGIVPVQEAYKSINWTVIFLIAAFIPMGAAMDNVELSGMIGSFFSSIQDRVGNHGLIAIFFFLTMIMTSFLSNNATAIIMTPLAIHTAGMTGLRLEPFIMSVMFAASLSFMTPNGYQTNTMVFTPGGYRYMDFIRVGIPLHLILGVLAVLLIPIFWPL